MPGDLIIKNGTVVDGSGRPPRKGTVAVRDGRIVDAASARPGSRVMDAEGKVVAPGFIDIHTHYDAQVLWDPLVTCSPWHGFTTVIMGNCGFTLAPCQPKDRRYLTHMFAAVEGMNVNALEQGLDWRWQGFPEYQRRIEEQRLGVNVGTMVGHSAVRRFVMGEAANTRQAAQDEVKAMKQLVREALASGAFGFSTSLQTSHVDGEGAPIPSRLATDEEILELGETLREFGTGSIEIITKTATSGPDRFAPEDEALMTGLSLRSGRPVNWNALSHNWERPTAWKNQMEYMERAARQGARVYAVARCQRLDVTFNLLMASQFGHLPTWKSVLSNPRDKAIALLREPKVRATMKREAEEWDPREQDIRRLANLALHKSKSGRFAQYEKKNLGQISQTVGKAPADILLDWSIEEDLETEFSIIGARNGDPQAVAEIIRSPYSLAGISDAGAHIDRLSGCYFSTFMLSHWVRDQKLVPLEDAVRRLTSMPASLYGITDRGLLEPGYAGDVVVFDLAKLDWLPSERYNDLPGKEGRLVNRATGYDHLVVDGDVVFEGERDTGVRPGKLLKSSQYRSER